MHTAMLASPHEGNLLTRREVAAFMQVSEVTVDRLVRRGLLRALRVARRVRFHLGDVHAFLRGPAAKDALKPYARQED